MARPGPTALLVVPDTNTTMERELGAHWPELGSILRVGIPRPPRPIQVDDLPQYRAATLAAVGPFAERRPDIVLYGCTTAGFLAGAAGDREMCDALAQAVQAPAVTTAYSMAEALKHEGVRRPAIVTPYLQASNDGLKLFLAAYGIEVAVLESLLFTTVEQYNNADETQVWDLALPTGRRPEADGLFIACTQLPTLGILDRLRRDCGKPVRGAIEATAWCGKRTLAGVVAGAHG